MCAAPQFVWTQQSPQTELQAFFQNAPVGFAHFHRDGDLTALNPALERMLERRSQTAQPVCLADLIHPEDRAEAERLFGELFAGQRDSFQIDLQSTGANRGPTRWTAWRMSARTDSLDYALAVAQDTLENGRGTATLSQSARLESLGRLAGGVAHDFNNLLTGILLYCDLLISSLEPGHRVRKYAEEIRSGGLQATGIVRQLLAVARPADSEPHLLSLNDVVEGMRNMLVHLIGENIELQLCLDPNLGLIKMDPAQAQQILLNLVLNARDAEPGGGRIVVETSNCKVQALTECSRGAARTASLPCVMFVVIDNGSGMDAATRARMFEAFFTTKASGKGNGLGLTTVHEIVTGNGGLIDVESAPGCGTRVTILLPTVQNGVPESRHEKDFQPEVNQQAVSSQEEE